MKCKIFGGITPELTISQFNAWAKGKALTREVLIHSLLAKAEDGRCPDLLILVYHPEGPEWDKTETPSKLEKALGHTADEPAQIAVNPT
jgi:hypothetical protein